MLQEYIYAACPQYDENGNRLTLSKMDTKQASSFFEDIRNYFASQFGFVIPDPNPNWRNDNEITGKAD